MRFLAFLCLLIALAAAGWAGQLLYQEWQTQHDPAAPRKTASVEPAEPQPPRPPAPPRSWPALFGEPQPPRPPAPPKQAEDEPQPPPKQFPPLASMGYVLKGTVVANETVWALVSHPTGEQVLRVGDALKDDLIVTGIDERGLSATPKGGDEMLLEWPE